LTHKRHWLILFAITVAEAVLAFLLFQAGPPFAYAGLFLVAFANIQWVAAVVIALKSASRRR
jgi:hypothetical protein